MGEPAVQSEMLPGAEPALDEKDLVTINRFASWVVGDATSIKNRAVAAGVDPMLERAGQKLYRIVDLFRVYGAENQFQRRARAQADQIEMKNAELRGELVPVQDHIDTLVRTFKGIAEVFDTLPDVLERDCGLPSAAVARAEQACDRVRTSLADSMVELSKMQIAPAATLEQKEVAAAAPVVKQPPTSGALDGAAKYLSQALAAGSRLAAELITEAGVLQISETSLRRAKSKLAIVARRAGKGWEWALAAQGVQGSQSERQP